MAEKGINVGIFRGELTNWESVMIHDHDMGFNCESKSVYMDAGAVYELK